LKCETQKEPIMKPRLLLLLLIVAWLPTACVVYEPVPMATTQERFDRSWAAAAGAMADEGLAIEAQDRGAGVIRGRSGGTTIVATVQTLADGRIQVKFDSLGAAGTDTSLVDRVSRSYDRRMGRY
jgi:hypothetical protein